MLIMHIDSLVWKSLFSQKKKTNAIYRKSKKIQRTSIRSNLKKVGTKKYKGTKYNTWNSLQNCWHYFSRNYMYKLANFFMILNTNLRHVWRICSSYYYHRSQPRQHIEIADVVTTFSWLNQKLVIYIIIKLLSWLTTMTKQICPVLNIVYYPSNKDINPVIICFGFWSSNL